MSFGLWIAILATANFLLYALWFRWFDRQPVTDSEHYCAAVDQAIDEQRRQEEQWRQWSLYGQRVWDAALDEERRVREEEAAWAQSGDELVREIEVWLESREMTS